MANESGLKDKERDAVNELRKRMEEDMEPEMYSDTYLFLRFIKARDFNIDNAETMLKKHLEWRKKYDVKNSLNFKKIEVIEKYCPNIFLGHDKEGCVVRYCPFGRVDFIGIVASLTPEEIAKCTIHENEEDTDILKKQTEKLGRNIDKCVYIYNFEHLSFAQVTDKKSLYNMIFMLNLYINNYPERLKAAYVLNASVYFNFMYSLIKTLLPNTILSKIHIYSDDSYKEDILKIIHGDVLPAFLGGSRTDPDGNPLCLTFINSAERVPQTYYLNKGKRCLAKAPGVQKVTLSRAAFHEVNIEVEETASYLEWEFETKCRDIGFGLFYQTCDTEENITELIPIQRIDTDIYPETGMFKCEIPGTYVIVFDNTYSWIRAKEIYFRTKLITPKEHEETQMKD